MRHVAFIELLDQVRHLTPAQRKQLVQRLVGREKASVPSTQPPLPIAITCPHCGAADDRLGAWGQSHGLKRYRCRDCNRTFNAPTGTALAHLRKREQWTRYAELLIEGVSLREAARCCQIDKNTAFRWRHRFLHVAAGHRAEHEAGIVEGTKPSFSNPSKASGTCPGQPDIGAA